MLQNPPEVIYHVAMESEFRAQAVADTYTPLRFADDGFIHCTAGRDLLLKVANDYFAHVTEPVVAVAIDTAKLQVELKMEPPIPIAGGGREHLQTGVLFPHIYGPLNLDAVIGVGRLQRIQAAGPWQWPQEMRRLEDFFSSPCQKMAEEDG